MCINKTTLINEHVNEMETSYGGNKYVISFVEGDSGEYHPNTNLYGNTKIIGDFVSPLLLSFIFHQVLPNFVSDHVTCFTENKCNGNIFCAHPSYRSNNE